MKVWWKRHLTMAQIVQFVIDLTATYPFVYFYVRHPMGCAGSMRAFIFGQAVGISFFYLFLDFFIKSYCRRRDQGRSIAKQRAATESTVLSLNDRSTLTPIGVLRDSRTPAIDRSRSEESESGGGSMGVVMSHVVAEAHSVQKAEWHA